MAMHPALYRAMHATAPAQTAADPQRARIESRRHFVQLKRAFMSASGDVPGALGVLLQREVRQASHDGELWALRSALLDSLPPLCERSALHHMALARPDSILGADLPRLDGPDSMNSVISESE